MPTFLAQRDGGGLVLLDSDTGALRKVPGAADLVADEVIRRDGWFALGYNMRAWSLSDDFQDRPSLLNGRHPAAHEDPELLWLNSETQAFSVDREGRTAREKFDLPPGAWLVARFDGSHVTWNPHVGSCTWHRGRHERDLGHFFLKCISGQYGFLVETGGGWSAAVLDMTSGDVQRLPLASGTWDLLCALSPDGRFVAATVQTSDPGRRRPEGMPISEWLRILRAQPRRDPQRLLAIIELGSATVRPGGDPLHDLPRVAWSHDSDKVTCWNTSDEDSWTTFARAGEVLSRRTVPASWPIPLVGVASTVM